MKIPAIKQLVENHSIEELKEAEEGMYEEKAPSFEVKGDDEGEQLTHIIAAIWILEKMEADGDDFKKALRAYTHKVRESISS